MPHTNGDAGINDGAPGGPSDIDDLLPTTVGTCSGLLVEVVDPVCHAALTPQCHQARAEASPPDQYPEAGVGPRS